MANALASNPEPFAAFVKNVLAKSAKVLKASGAKVE